MSWLERSAGLPCGVGGLIRQVILQGTAVSGLSEEKGKLLIPVINYIDVQYI